MTILTLLLHVGTLVFAIVGVLNARIAGMDPVGGLVIVFLTGFDGGTVRDLLIDAHPVYWINAYWPLVAVASRNYFSSQHPLQQIRKNAFAVDAPGIGFVTVSTIERSIQLGVNVTFAVTMGVVTATFGGVIADIVRNEVPILFKPGELYASACLIGCIIYISLRNLNLDASINALICIAVVALIRFSSHRRKVMSH